MKMKTALTIAGSDCSGGAGIQADIKTMTMHGVYAMSVVTSLTAQNTVGVRAIQNATPQFLAQQIDAVFEDIFPDAVKTGMVPSARLVEVVAERLKYHNAKNVDTGHKAQSPQSSPSWSPAFKIEPVLFPPSFPSLEEFSSLL